ncbi:MAG TPA: DUF2071 domain-containing protein, partial [Gemmatimonadota bacterium]|nr:DUF2071 domain-containing protein [Gemmatimonadota bacterium]
MERNPRARGSPRVIGRQRWRDLLFLHWAVPPEVLRSLVPPRLSIDLYQGIAYAGIVAFDSTRLRPVGASERLGLDFPETNVRTYVRLEEGAPDPAP